ncbi:hypothetical protein BGW80DRAFT_1409241 [Lactifluus volemus]|nr:hypothetical protein BGW80DRAFT_1409241 [Lactifluus volemus]
MRNFRLRKAKRRIATSALPSVSWSCALVTKPYATDASPPRCKFHPLPRPRVNSALLTTCHEEQARFSIRPSLRHHGFPPE